MVTTTTSVSPAPVARVASAASGHIRILTGSQVDDVLASLDPEAAVASQQAVFAAFSAARASPASTLPAAIQTPQRLTLRSDDQTMLFMPSRAGPVGTGCKIVSVPTGGGANGLPGTTVIMDEKTGKVKAIVNARKLTALRNAAGSALFYRSFPAPEAPRHLLIFGSGAQAAAHAHLFLKLWPSCESCTIVARRSTDRVDALVSELQDAFPSVKVSLGVSTYPSAPEPSDGAFDLQSAVHNANVIITVTPSREPLFNSVDVTSNTRVVMVGSYTPDMHEVDEQLIRRAGIVVVDSREACLQEAGELIAARLRPEQMVELGEVVGAGGEGAVDLVQQNGDIVVFKSVGVGIQDVAIANVILQEAERRGVGQIIESYD